MVCEMLKSSGAGEDENCSDEGGRGEGGGDWERCSGVSSMERLCAHNQHNETRVGRKGLLLARQSTAAVTIRRVVRFRVGLIKHFERFGLRSDTKKAAIISENKNRNSR